MKAIYERLHPEAKAGTARAAGMNRKLGRGDVDEIISPTFTADTKAKTNLSQRTDQLALVMGRHYNHKKLPIGGRREANPQKVDLAQTARPRARGGEAETVDSGQQFRSPSARARSGGMGKQLFTSIACSSPSARARSDGNILFLRIFGRGPVRAREERRANPQKVDLAQTTAEALASDYGVSHMTIERAGKFAAAVETLKAVDPELAR